MIPGETPSEDDMTGWEHCPVSLVGWLQIGGQGFAVREGTFKIEDGWASWAGDNGCDYGAPVTKIEAVGY